MATVEQLKNALIQAHNQGDMQAAEFFAGQIRQMQSAQQAQQQEQAIYQQAAQEVPWYKVPLIGAGRAFMDIGRAVGLADPATASEEQAYRALQEEAPIGTAIGEAAPYAVASVPLGGMAYAPRVASMAGLGAAEVAAPMIARGEDVSTILGGAGTGAAIAGGFEAALPVFGRLIGSAYRKATGTTLQRVTDEAGNVLPEVRATLEASGIDPDELKGIAVDMVKQSPSGADEAARMARFEAQGIPYTPGDISQQFGQRSKEARLLELQDEPMAEQLRQLRTTQAEKIGVLKDQLSQSLGDPDLAGEAVKLGLDKAEDLSRAKKNELYDILAEKAGMSGGIPIPEDKLMDTLISDPDFVGMASQLAPNERESINKLLVQYGIDQSPEMVEEFMKAAQKPQGLLPTATEIMPLTTKNAEDLSKSLNRLVDFNSSPALKGVVGKLKGAVDEGYELIDDSLKDVADEVRDAAKAARKANVELKQQFSPQSIVGKLKGVKKDGITPITESSNVYNALFKPGRTSTAEQVERTITQLGKTKEGREAIGNLQSNLVLDVLDKGFAKSDRLDGQMLFHGNKALNHLEKLGTKEVDTLFANNPEALTAFKDLIQTGVDITPSQKEVLKGSAGLIANVLKPLADMGAAVKFNLPGGVVNALSKISQAGSDQKALKELFKKQPKLKKHAGYIQQNLPNMAVLLGLTQIDEGEE